MGKIKRKFFFLLHILLLPLFFIVHNWFDFYLLTNFNELKEEIFLWLLLPFFSLAVFYWPFRNIFKSALLTSVLLVILFFATSFMAFARNTKLLLFLGNYSVLLTVLGLLLIALFLWLRKSKSNHLQVHQFLFYCFLILLVYEPVHWLIGGKQKSINKNRLKLPGIPDLTVKPLVKDSLPDIYYLLFDELAASETYQQLIAYDNSANDRLLSFMGFKIAKQAYAATNHTHTAMPSVFNMCYLPFIENQQVGFREMHALINNINKNPVIPFLKNNGYKIFNAGIFRLDDAPGLTKPDLWTLHSANDMITDQILYRNLWNNFGWMIQSKLTSKPKSVEKLVSDTALINEALSIVQKTIADTVSQPKFLYAHFYLPHGPVRYDSSGNILQWKSYGDYNLKNESFGLYREQVKYTFRLIIKLCNQIQQQSKRPTVIILQGDHGIRNYDTTKFNKELSFRPYAAFYFPEGSYTTISDSFYMPNTFRVVLNQYFQQKLPMLSRKIYKLNVKKDEVLFKR
jgi:hypothetical protein